MSSEIMAAVIAAAVSVAVAVAGHFLSYRMQRERLRQELRTEFMAEQAILELLSLQGWQKRSFDEIARKIGGFTEDELRRLLVRAGAVRFQRRRGGAELWGLLKLNRDDLAKAESEPE